MINHVINNTYQIQSVIGRGAMGIVYRAINLTTQQLVAIKFLHHYADELTTATITRFQREFKILAQLKHPNIVQAYDSGSYNNTPYLVLELLEGQTLKENLTTGPLAREQLLFLARQMCDALAYIHNHSIIHRDIKPGNLMLIPNNGDFQVKLMDFGLVRKADYSMNLTQEGITLGTVAYIPPEQAQGISVDFRADLYSLGVTMYEMATGRPPFVADNPITILMHQITTPPPSPRHFNPDLDESLTHLILQLLAKEPAQRPAGAELVSARLAHIANETVPILTPLPKRADLIPRVPLIGQKAALNTLIEYWTQSKNNQGQVVLLSGVAGAGKTRLLTELNLTIQFDRGLFLQSNCYEQGALPYQPIIDILDNLLPNITDSIKESLPFQLKNLLPSIKSASTSAPSNNQGQTRQQLFAACWQIIQHIVQKQPLLIAIEDLQWADPTTLELLGYLAHQSQQSAIFFVFSYRLEEVEQNESLKTLLHTLSRSSYVHSLTVNLLTKEQVAEFLKTALGWEKIPELVVEVFYSATSGTPLFIEETLKALAAEGQVAQLADYNMTVSTTITNITLQLPQSVLDLAERRLQILSPEDRSILTTAAALGQEFTFEVLQGVAKINEDDLIDAIEHLLSTRLIEELPIQNDEDRYRFSQESLRQALLKNVSGRRLRMLHRRAAEAIQTIYNTNQSRYWPILAYHFAQASQAKQAIKYYKLAADSAANVYAYPEAIAHYYAALQIIKEKIKTDSQPDFNIETIITNQNLTELYTKFGRNLELNNQYQEALSTYDDMLTMATTLNNTNLKLTALLAKTTILSTPTSVQNLQLGEELAQQTLELAQQLGEQEAEAKSFWNLLLVNDYLARFEKAVEYGEKGLTIARTLNLRELLAYILNDLHSPYVVTNQKEKANAVLIESQQLWRELNNMPMLVDNLCNSAREYNRNGDVKKTLSLATEALTISKSINNLWGQSNAGNILSQLYLAQGQINKAIEMLNHVVKTSAQITPLQAFVNMQLGWLYISLGAIEQGNKYIAKTKVLDKEQLKQMWPYLYSIQARVHLLQGNIADAEAIIKQGKPEVKDQDINLISKFWLIFAESLVAFTKNDYEHALKLQNQLINVFKLDMLSPSKPYLYYHKAKTLLAQNKTQEAYKTLMEACKIAKKLESRRYLWSILALLAPLESQIGDNSKANMLWKQAYTTVEYIADHIDEPELRDSFLSLPDVKLIKKHNNQ